MYQALAKYKDSEEWFPVKFHGLPYYADIITLEKLVATMVGIFPNLDYKIEEMI